MPCRIAIARFLPGFPAIAVVTRIPSRPNAGGSASRRHPAHPIPHRPRMTSRAAEAPQTETERET